MPLDDAPFFQTERLSLRRATLDDVDLFFALDSDPDVMRFIGDGHVVTDRRRTEAAVVERVLTGDERWPGLGLWVCETRQEGQPIGWAMLKPCVLSFYHEGVLHEPTSHIELGYRLLGRAWGQGYATEAARALVDYGFERLGLPEILAVAIAEHAASIRVLYKAGLVDYGRARYQGMNVNVYGVWRGRALPPPLPSSSPRRRRP